MAAAPMRSLLPTRRRIPCLRGVGCCRIWVSWRSRCLSEHVNSSVKRCRVVKDRIRLWKDGVRDLVMELCCALHNFRVRLTPWQPMV